MTTFRCKRSGNTVSFSNQNDIEQLRKHDGYEEVRDEIKAETVTDKTSNTEVPEKSIIDRSVEDEEKRKPKVLIKRGRPKTKK